VADENDGPSLLLDDLVLSTLINVEMNASSAYLCRFSLVSEISQEFEGVVSNLGSRRAEEEVGIVAECHDPEGGNFLIEEILRPANVTPRPG
jgi:hypothetical protein